MSKITYTILSNGDESNVTAIVPGEPMPLTAHSSHPNFAAIVAGLVVGELSADDCIELFDVSQAVAKRFDNLSERITVANGVIYLDGDAIHNSLTNQILRFMDEGVDDWKPLVAFFEKVQANPNAHSREQLYGWLENQEGITISPIGNVVGYKGVGKDADGQMFSIHSGTAIVDGEQVSGRIPNRIGSTVEMPRTNVAHDPSTACSRGLHVGTFRYASSWAQGAMLECHVNPRDVVSVPTDGGGEKVRVCRYIIAGALDAPHTSALLEVDGENAGIYDEDEVAEWLE